jgi:uncharacterized RDD family membrane protein YckC
MKLSNQAVFPCFIKFETMRCSTYFRFYQIQNFMEQNQNSLHPDLLTDYNTAASFEDATTGQRFANYIIDLIVFYVLAMIFGVILGIILYSTNPESTFFDDADTGIMGSILDRLIALLFYGLYMSITEGLFKGRTLGKLITGTKAVRYEDGSDINWSDAFKRGFSRAVPFEPFSAFGGRPWHDTWTDTRVVKIRK